MQASELARKLKVEPGSLCLVVNPPAGYLDRKGYAGQNVPV